MGLRVATPAAVANGYEIGDHAQLFTHLVVREDNLSLYGSTAWSSAVCSRI